MGAYLSEEFARVSAASRADSDGFAEVTHVVPDKPRDGMWRYFDGIDANPTGGGEGVYVYHSGVWNKMDQPIGWRDLEGEIIASATGANRPVLTTYIGEIEDYAFAANDHYSIIKYHVPHDYVLGSDLFIHSHWSHNGTNISGSLVIDHRFTYSKGHNQAAFHAEKALVQTISGLTIANTPTLQHRIDEIQFSTSGGSASQIDTDLLEPDGLILLHFNVPTIPTITGGAAKPFIHYVDCHYQSNNVGSLNKAPNFFA